jgi:hypothetical protein
MDWYFDPALDDQTVAWLTKALQALVANWFDVTYAEVRDHLSKHPNQKYAASLKGAELTAQGLAQNMSYLCLLTCDRDIREPTQCLIFVGSETYTRAKCDEFQAHVLKHAKSQPGAETLIVEHNDSETD